jgi:hypothetical protein
LTQSQPPITGTTHTLPLDKLSGATVAYMVHQSRLNHRTAFCFWPTVKLQFQKKQKPQVIRLRLFTTQKGIYSCQIAVEDASD